jgi:ATP-dependent DNA helicase RecG
MLYGFILLRIGNNMAVIDPQAEIASVPGVGAQRGALLAKLGIVTVTDLLYHLPHRYEDRRKFVELSKAEAGTTVCWRGKIQKAKSTRWRGGRLVFEVVMTPPELTSAAEVLCCRWFNVYYLPKSLTVGKELIVYGKLVAGKKGWTMVHPEFEILEHDEDELVHMNRITPIYPLTEGLSQRVLRRIQFGLTRWADFEFPEYYPAPSDLQTLSAAFPSVHFPQSWESMQGARQRLAYDEFFRLQCVLAERRQHQKKAVKVRAVSHDELAGAFLKNLPFQPTGAQGRVMDEIRKDLALPVPMNRLLQGDVGAGKTLVAVYAMLLAVGRGKQAALMAPTEILAEQHCLNLRRWLAPLGVRVGLLTGSKKSGMETGDGTAELALGAVPLPPGSPGLGAIVVGTHALIYDSYVADQLGLVVIDEQHKFGVLQRLALANKGDHPDILVMTATPIPRTLGMTLYGDLDVSVLDELPPGRQKIITACRSSKELDKVWKFISEQTAAGRQAYVVYPLVEESEKVEAKAVQTEFENIRVLFPHTSIGLLHGRMKPEEKDRVMTEFRAGKVQVLVSTSVIEVGVDVPNATIMVIENAERFGLAQLHQLRGRIGRGSEKSYCVLVGEPHSKESWQRLKIMEQTGDGFIIAEEDLKIRGPGNILGTEQSGLPPLRVANLVTDFDLLQRARRDADEFMKQPKALEKYPVMKAQLRQYAKFNTLAAVG